MSKRWLLLAIIVMVATIIATTVIMEQSILYSTEESVGSRSYTTSKSLLGSIKNVVIKCVLPKVPEKLPVLAYEYRPVNESVKMIIAKLLLGSDYKQISDKTFVEKKGGCTRVLHVNGLNELILFSSRHCLAEVRSGVDIVSIARSVLTTLMRYYALPPGIRLVTDSVRPGMITVIRYLNESEVRKVLEMCRYYRLYYGDVELIGPGADFYICVTGGGKISRIELHVPYLRPIKYVRIITPQEAIEKLRQGEITEPIPRGLTLRGTVIVHDIKLVYWIDRPGEQRVVEPAYMITMTVETETGQELGPFKVLVPATAG